MSVQNLKACIRLVLTEIHDARQARANFDRIRKEIADEFGQTAVHAMGGPDKWQAQNVPPDYYRLLLSAAISWSRSDPEANNDHFIGGIRRALARSEDYEERAKAQQLKHSERDKVARKFDLTRAPVTVRQYGQKKAKT